MKEVPFGELNIGDKFIYVDETWTKTSKNLAKIAKFNSSFDRALIVEKEDSNV